MVILEEWKKVMFRLVEITIMLAVGLLVTFTILKPIYEHFGIAFLGNVWVNWFGVSYLFFVFYTVIGRFLLCKNSVLFKHRINSVLFWLFFVGATYVVFIPFIKGENPF
ncbi:hypothetical protein ACWE42_10205 [Sutcliffiella cohnii]